MAATEKKITEHVPTPGQPGIGPGTARHGVKEMERKHREGYERHPVTAEEFSVWETEQAWGDD